MNLNLQCAINDLGYGNVGRGFTVAWVENDLGPLAVFPIGRQVLVQNEYEAQIFKPCIDNQGTFDFNAPCLKIWHQFDLAERIGKGLSCGLSFFELDTLKPNEVNHLNSLDVIWTPSQWGFDVLVNNGFDPSKIFIQPAGINTNIFFPANTNIQNEKYTFISIGKIEYRKGHDILPVLFDKAFRGVNDVKLQMMWFNPFMNQQEHEEWMRMYKNLLGDKVEFIPHVKADNEVADIINRADCGIFPTRAEGFGLPILQMMACNKPVIVTNYSGLTQFCDANNAYLVDITEKEDAYDGKWFNGEGQWAKLGRDQEDTFIDKMRYCYQNRPANLAGVETAKSLNWSIVVKNFKDHLTKLTGVL